jgi:protein-tyrosine phosphatase
MSPHLADEALADPRRLVVLQAVHNFRDLGGYTTEDDRVTSWGRLYRADGLYRLTGDDLEVIRSLGLRTVIDLRSQAELDERGTFPHHEVPVDFSHLPIIDATWQVGQVTVGGTDGDFLVDAYRHMLTAGAPRFAMAMQQLAAPDALPAVFHCAAGKDRTGLLAALILGSIGVPRRVILGDYALTAGGMARMREWARRELPDMAGRMAEVPSAFLAALPEALDHVLDDLCSQHGSIRGFVRSIGVTAEVIDALSDALLAPLA